MEHTDQTINDDARFMKCTHCGTVHIKAENINDHKPTCKSCGSINFIPVTKGTPGYMPLYCDQAQESEIFNGVMASFLAPIYNWKAEIEEKYKIKLSKKDIHDLTFSISTVGKLLVDTSRDTFLKDSFIQKLKEQFKSYLFSKKKKRIKTKNKNE